MSGCQKSCCRARAIYRNGGEAETAANNFSDDEQEYYAAKCPHCKHWHIYPRGRGPQ